MMAVLIAVLIGGYYLFQQHLREALIGLRHAEIWALSPFNDHFRRLDIWLAAIPYGERSWGDAKVLSLLVGNWTRWPVGLFCLWLAYWSFSRLSRFRRTYNLEQLIQSQAIAFPTLTPLLQVDPSRSTRPVGMVPKKVENTWQEALSTTEWAGFYKVLAADGTIDPLRVRQAMVKQLGGAWKGVEQMPFYSQALLAIFLTYGNRDRATAKSLLNDIALCWKHQKGLLPSKRLSATVAGQLALYKEDLARLVKRHGSFVNILLIAAFDHAHERAGTADLPSSLFIWLRPTDRHLWYCLQQLPPPRKVGLIIKSKRPEAAGSLAHYEVELEIGRPSFDPMVDAAVTAFIAAYQEETKEDE